MSNRVAFKSGQWIAANQLTVSIHDPAVSHGATAVERLRAYGGKLFRVQRHLERFLQSAAVLRIEGLPNPEEIHNRILEIIDRNQTWLAAQSDFGVLLIATQGIRGAATFIVDLFAIDRQAMARRVQTGTPLMITNIQQPAPECWPRNIKVRSRLHYYLADQLARDVNPDALGVVVDADGTITETSIANIMIVERETVFSPPDEQVLKGISLQTVMELAKDLGMDWQQERLPPSRLRAADEVILSGTSCGLWFANQVDEAKTPPSRPVFDRLRASFDRLVENFP